MHYAILARVSYIGSKQHHPKKQIHWDREKSTDDLDALMRHLMENGMYDIDGVRHTAKIALESFSTLTKMLEEDNVRDEQWHKPDFYIAKDYHTIK